MVYMPNAIGSSSKSNPSRRICHLHVVPLGYVATRSKKAKEIYGKIQENKFVSLLRIATIIRAEVQVVMVSD